MFYFMNISKLLSVTSLSRIKGVEYVMTHQNLASSTRLKVSIYDRENCQNCRKDLSDLNEYLIKTIEMI